jgi:hypothetical protein
MRATELDRELRATLWANVRPNVEDARDLAQRVLWMLERDPADANYVIDKLWRAHRALALALTSYGVDAHELARSAQECETFGTELLFSIQRYDPPGY